MNAPNKLKTPKIQTRLREGRQDPYTMSKPAKESETKVHASTSQGSQSVTMLSGYASAKCVYEVCMITPSFRVISRLLKLRLGTCFSLS